MDATVESMAAAALEAEEGSGGGKTASSANAPQLPVCAEMFLKDLSLFVRRKAGQWLVGQ